MNDWTKVSLPEILLKKCVKDFFRGVFFGIWFLLVIGLGYIVYGANPFSWNAGMTTATSWGIIPSSGWNAMVNNIQYLNGQFGTLGSSAYQNIGTGANNVVQLDASGKLPAVDGSSLTNLPSGGGWVFFWGMYSTSSTYCAATNNSVTGWQSCPSWFTAHLIWCFVCNASDSSCRGVYMCVK